MAVPSSGAISIQDLVDEFGGSSPHSISEYYRGGGLVPDVSANNSVPTSGAISLTESGVTTLINPQSSNRRVILLRLCTSLIVRLACLPSRANSSLK